MTQSNYDKSVILRKMYAEDLTLAELHTKLGECEFIEDLHLENSEKKYIIGTIRKPYRYDAKRTIGLQDVTGQDECKFFKFLIREEMGYFLIACHYEASFGGFSILRDFLIGNVDDVHFEIIYKIFENIKIADLKKIQIISSTYEKKQKHFGVFKKTKQEVIEVAVNENDIQEIATKENISQYIELPDIADDENTVLYLILKNKRKINILQPQNTHFKLDNLKYENDLPERNDFVTKVYKIWEKI